MLRRNGLWVAFIVVFVPLLVLLGLQYWWLTDLEQTSAIARKATLDNFLEAVATKIEYSYRSSAEQALNIPSSLFTQGKVYKAAYHFKKKKPEGVKRLFVYWFSPDEDAYGPYFYDGSKVKMGRRGGAEEWTAVAGACAPWAVLSHKGTPYESGDLSVDEMDPRNRIILNPITDDRSRVVGVAGMIVDEEYLREVLLPYVLKKTLPKFFTHQDKENLIVTVRDGKGRLAVAFGDAEERRDDAVRAFPLIFTDWRLGLQSRYTTPEQWARTNFALNMTLSVLIAVVLMGGVVLALRTASREIHLSRMKSDFVSNVSHELRTPLASIRVFGEFLRLGRVESQGKAREYGEYIESESRRLTQLIHNILDFSKIESGQKIYQFERADVSEVIADTLKTFEVRLKHNGFTIRFERVDDLPEVTVDVGAIAQAFNNLVDNAVKYSGESKEIGVRLVRVDGFIVISVRDEGIGISKDEQEKIFERFHRVGTGLIHEVKGSGLGLAIVNHIVQAHAGRVTVDSEVGKGSVFSIHLPLHGQPRRSEPHPELVEGEPVEGARGPEPVERVARAGNE